MPESQDESAAILERPPDPAPPPPRKSRRFWFRFTLALFAVMTIAIVWSGWYVYSKGFTKRWRNFLSAELRRYGLDVTVRRITLDPFEGLVAHDVVLKRADRDGGPVLTISRTALDINLAQLFQRETFLNSIDLRDARAIIPIDARDPNGPRFEVKNLRAKILFPPGHIRLTLAEGEVEGIQFSASGLVASSGDTPPFLRDDAITGEALEARRRLSRTLLDELKKLKFGSEAPRVVVEFAGDLAKPDTLQATARLTAAGVQRGTYQLKSLQLLARFEDGLIKLENGEISDARGRLNAQGDFRPSTGAASGRVRSDLDLASALAEFWPAALNYGLSSREPPKVEFSVRGRIPGANPPPDAPVAGTEAIPDFEIVGRLESGPLTARGLAFEGLKTEFSWRDGLWYLRGGRLVHRSGELVADIMNADGEFKAKVISTIDPDVLAPLLLRPGRNLLNEMAFQDSPRIEFTAEGKSLTDFASMQARGRVEVSKTKFRGVPLQKASCDVELKNQAVSFRKIVVEREEGRVTADGITYDFGRHELRIDNGRSNCIPNDVMMWIDPNWMKFVRPYRWKRPPAVKVDGVVQFHGRMNTKLVIDYDAPAGMDYTFAKRALVITKFSGQLLFTEHRLQLNNLRGELFEGRWRASADIPVNRPGVAYSAKVETEDSDFQAFAKTYFGFGDTHGRMSARYEFTGRGDDPATLVGTGTVKVDKGNVFAIPVFGPLSAVLDKAGLGYDKANQASAEYTTKDGRVETKNFLVKGAGFSMIGSGWVNYLNDKMDFRVRVNAQGLPGVVLYAVSKLFEFHTDGPFTDPVWKPMMGTVPAADPAKPAANATKPSAPITPPPRPVPTPAPTPAKSR